MIIGGYAVTNGCSIGNLLPVVMQIFAGANPAYLRWLSDLDCLSVRRFVYSVLVLSIVYYI